MVSHCEIPWECVPSLSTLEVCSLQGAIQIHVYFTFVVLVECFVKDIGLITLWLCHCCINFCATSDCFALLLIIIIIKTCLFLSWCTYVTCLFHWRLTAISCYVNHFVSKKLLSGSWDGWIEFCATISRNTFYCTWWWFLLKCSFFKVITNFKVLLKVTNFHRHELGVKLQERRTHAHTLVHWMVHVHTYTPTVHLSTDFSVCSNALHYVQIHCKDWVAVNKILK